MKKTTVLLAAMGALVLLTAGAALAATVDCDGGRCVGTRNEDTLRGTGGVDKMFGFAGNDRISGSYSGDFVYGGSGIDTIRGDYGADTIYGQDGNDELSGGPVGDRIFAGPGYDVVDGGVGPDRVSAADGMLDSVSCGSGNDTAVVDRADLSRQSFEDFVRLSSCENVEVR